MDLARLLIDSAFKRSLIVILIAVVPLLSAAKRPVHDFESKCETCHLSLSDSKGIFVKEIDFLCSECHRNLGLSHPSGMKPSMPVPDKFPLDWAGRMTCATCHKVHGDSEVLLRGGRPGKAFCYECHKGIMGRHGGSSQAAHSGSSVSVRGFEIVNSKEPIDSLSKECLTCHDSVLGSSANIRIGAGIWNHGNGVSHPIGAEYMSAYRKGGFKHPSGINASIRLFGGKVGCGSCHNLYSKEKHQLAMSNRGSALCFGCHNK